MNPDELRKLLARRVGPLPVGAWLVIAGVGVAAIAYVARRRAATPEPVDAPTGDEAPGDGLASTITRPTPFTLGGFAIPGAVQATGSGVPTSNPLDGEQPEPQTNSDWEQRANRYAIARGIQGTIASGAFAKYLMGEALDPQELNIVDLTLSAIGPPPEPVPPPVVKPSPTGGSTGGNAQPPAPTATVTDAEAVRLARAGRPLPAGYRISAQSNGQRWLVKGAWGVRVAIL